MGKGNIVVIEGACDGIGKSTQISLLRNYLEDNGKVVKVMTIYEPHNGRAMDVLTDQVALQFYSGNFFDSSYDGKYGKPLSFRESVVFETQKYPDAVNHENFPSVVLNPGEEYKHTCIYRFYTK